MDVKPFDINNTQEEFICKGKYHETRKYYFGNACRTN